MGSFIDLTGQTFGRLRVEKRAKQNSADNRVCWICKCSCGNTVIRTSHALRTEGVKSCGCLQKDTMRRIRTTHGLCGEKLHGVWRQMRQRCANSKNKDYGWYGGRGIQVCSAWDDYVCFRNWALANGYQEGLTIERINPDGNYCPENCTWITLKAQQQNRRSSLSYRRLRKD